MQISAWQRLRGWLLGWVTRVGCIRARSRRPESVEREASHKTKSSRPSRGARLRAFVSPDETQRHITFVDGTGYELATHVAQLVASSAGVPVLLDGPLSSTTLGTVVLFPVGQHDANTDEAMRYLSAFAQQSESAGTPIPIVLIWCVRAVERIDAVLPHRGGTDWGNQISLTTAAAWNGVRARHRSDEAALQEVDTRMSQLFSATSHNTALGGNTQRALHYVDRIARGRFHFSMLAECLSQSGTWHGHDMVAAAIQDLVPGVPPGLESIPVGSCFTGMLREPVEPTIDRNGRAEP